LRVIAVSPDLLRMGLRRGQRVRIHGLKGEFVVLDKMPRRWQKRIDIYMHRDLRAARRWGKRWVKISWVDPH
jgi:3D (Asp-Asp-Asp) domain-containing protein